MHTLPIVLTSWQGLAAMTTWVALAACMLRGARRMLASVFCILSTFRDSHPARHFDACPGGNAPPLRTRSFHFRPMPPATCTQLSADRAPLCVHCTAYQGQHILTAAHAWQYGAPAQFQVPRAGTYSHCKRHADITREAAGRCQGR
jgi:hypothetical protein